jgi:hypothetical protein
LPLDIGHLEISKYLKIKMNKLILSMIYPIKDLNHTHLFLFYLVITFIIKVIVDWIIHNVEMDDCDENLGSFWKNIRGIEQKIWYTNEIYQRKKLGI